MTESSPLLNTIFLGVVRGTCVHTLIYPFESLKGKIQADLGRSTISQIIQREGVFGLYQGLPTKLVHTTIKQIWVWPLITHMPTFLPPFYQQAATGIAIATIDACLFTPLETKKMGAILRRKKVKWLSWNGFSFNYAKLFVSWPTFLMAEYYFRSKDQNKQSSTSDLILRGVRVASIVALLTAPLDIAHTLYQNGNLKDFSFKKMHIGLPLNLTSLIVHNIASAILMEYLCNSSKNQEKF